MFFEPGFEGRVFGGGGGVAATAGVADAEELFLDGRAAVEIVFNSHVVAGTKPAVRVAVEEDAAGVLPDAMNFQRWRINFAHYVVPVCRATERRMQSAVLSPAQLATYRVLGDIEIVAGLKIDPELRRHAKVVTKA